MNFQLLKPVDVRAAALGKWVFHSLVKLRKMNLRGSSVRKSLVFISVILLAAAVSRSACAESIERANQEDIKRLLSAASGVNSAFWASLIGETRGRVYIEYETVVHVGSSFSNQVKRVVYWLPRSEITNEQLARFKAYKEKYESTQ